MDLEGERPEFGETCWSRSGLIKVLGCKSWIYTYTAVLPVRAQRAANEPRIDASRSNKIVTLI